MNRIALLLAVTLSLAAWDINDDLLSSARAGDLNAVKAAVERGAPVEAKTPYGQTPLYLAAMNGHEAVVRYLLEKGASAEITDTFYKASVLAFVMQRKHFGVAKLLIPHLKNNPDQTLASVAQTGNAELVQAVLDNGKPSQSALDRQYELALERKQAEPAAILKKAGAHEPAAAITVDVKILESYVGTYKGDMGEIKFFVRDGKLLAQPTGGPEFTTKAVSATKFLIPQAQLEIEFDTPGGFTFKQGNAVLKFKKAGPQ